MYDVFPDGTSFARICSRVRPQLSDGIIIAMPPSSVSKIILLSEFAIFY
jgi:hypothetical protein